MDSDVPSSANVVTSSSLPTYSSSDCNRKMFRNVQRAAPVEITLLLEDWRISAGTQLNHFPSSFLKVDIVENKHLMRVDCEAAGGARVDKHDWQRPEGSWSAAKESRIPPQRFSTRSSRDYLAAAENNQKPKVKIQP